MGTPTTAMHKLLLLVAGVSCAPQPQRAQQQAYSPQGAAARYEKVPVYREQEKPLEKRQAAYGPAVVAVEKLPPQPFQYVYGVKDDYSGNAFAKTETQNDLGQVQGSYKVNLPDGRVQTATYHADHEGGFVAEVTYEGTPQYPEPPPGGYGPYKGPGAYPGPPPPGSYTRRR